MYDIIIVGGGVAGCYLAHKLANTNLNILLIEKDKKVFLKDSGIVSGRIFDVLKDRKLVDHEIYEMKALSEKGKEITLRSFMPFAYIIKREELSSHLRNLAKKKADIAYETVIKIERMQTFFVVKTNSGEYRCRFLIGADGAYSLVRRTFEIKSPPLYRGIFVRTEKKLETDKITVFLNKYYSPDFFSWIIPQTKEYGLLTSFRPKEYFSYFKKDMNLPSGEIHSYLLPLGYTKSYANRMLLVGDACGQSKPITGGGIVFSMTCADYAADCIEKAFHENRFDESFLSIYEFLWKRKIGNEIKKQLFFRKIYRKMSNKDVENFFEKIGPYVNKTEEFDYDNLSEMAKKIPTWHLFKYFIRNISLVF